MLHTNYIGSFHYIARGIGQLHIQVPAEERELVDRFEHAYSRFLDYDDGDMIKLVWYLTKILVGILDKICPS